MLEIHKQDARNKMQEIMTILKTIFKTMALYGATLLSPCLLPAQNLTLKDAVNIALKNSPGLLIAKNGVDIASIYNSYGYAGGLPLVTASGSDVEQSTSLKQKYFDPANNKSSLNAASNNVSGGLNASMLLYNGDRVSTAKKRLGVQESQTRQQLSSRALFIVYNVMLKYYDIIRQQNYSKTLQTSIDASRERLNIVKSQQSIGLANNADLFQSQVDLNTTLQNLQAQRLVVDQDKTDLLTLLTLNPDSSVSIADTIVVTKDIRLESIINGLQANPDIVAADDQIRINSYIEKETGALRYPSVGVNTGYNYSRTQQAAGFSLLNLNYGPFAGVSFNIPIFNGLIYRKQQQVAGINTKTSKLQKDTLVLNYTANAVKSWQAYTSSLQQLETAKSNYDLSKQLLDLVLQRFELRQATIVDVRDAQQSFENAGYMLTNLSFAAKMAEVQLLRYANQLSY